MPLGLLMAALALAGATDLATGLLFGTAILGLPAAVAALILGLRIRRDRRGPAAVMIVCSLVALSLYVLLIAVFLAGVGDPEIR